MDHDAVLSRFRDEDRSLEWPGEVLEQTPFVTRRLRSKGGSTVTAYAVTPENADSVIASELAYFGDREFEWKVFSFDEPADLRARLSSAGFAEEPEEALLFFDLHEGLPEAGTTVCHVVAVEHRDQLKEFKMVAEAVFGKDYSMTTEQLGEALDHGDATHRAYLGYIDGEPVSVGRLYMNPDSSFAGLYGGGTMEDFRGRGCYRALIAARAVDAHANGSRYLQVDALPTSRPILLQLGFEHVADTWPCISPRKSTQ